jgi:SAM-dependent methyltransferase
MRSLLRQGARGWHHSLWAAMPTTVRTGRSSAPEILGAPLYPWLQEHRSEATDFDLAKVAFSGRISRAVLASADLSGVRRLVDVGGGLGHFLAVVLPVFPGLEGVLFDLPAVVEEAGGVLGAAGVLARVERVGGDFFTAIPAGADLYYLMNVLHNWGDADAVRILRQVRAALGPDARAWIVEMVLPERCEGHFGALLDLEMLALFGDGRERCASEFEAIFAEAGLTLRRVVPTMGPYSILELSLGEVPPA